MIPSSAPFRSLLRKRISYGLVLAVLLLIGVMTALFWKSQSLQTQVYARYVGSLHEIKFFQMKLYKDLEPLRFGRLDDTLQIYSSLSIVKDLVTSAASASDWHQKQGDWVAPDSLYGELERMVLVQSALVRRLIQTTGKPVATTTESSAELLLRLQSLPILLICDKMIEEYGQRIEWELQRKHGVQMLFYFLNISTVLVVLVLAVRLRNPS